MIGKGFIVQIRLHQLGAALFLSLAINASAAVLYVDLNSTNPAPPYTNWLTAATNIQDAVDAASPGDQIRLTNGVYQTGGRLLSGSLTNRVIVNKAVTVQSVNGPAVTTIQGYQVPGRTNGASAVRGVYLANGATLSGLTITRGATATDQSPLSMSMQGGGVYCESASAVVSNCIVAGNSAGEGGGTYSGTLINCWIIGNQASAGGGAASGTLNHCWVISNSVPGFGGGVADCLLNDCFLARNSGWVGGGATGGTMNSCTLSNNAAGNHGGGAYRGTLNNCAVLRNSAFQGGGAEEGTLSGCLLIGNSSSYDGGGAYSATLTNCALIGNLTGPPGYGGGANRGALYNCVLVSNSAGVYGGGAFSATVVNSTLIRNSAGYAGGGACWGILKNCIVDSQH